MNVYSELLELLTPPPAQPVGGLIGTVTKISPLTVAVRGTRLSEGLLYPSEMLFTPEDVGKTVALLPWDGGFFILFFTKGGDS